MLKRVVAIGILTGFLGSITLRAQISCVGNTGLVCLIPTVLHTTSSTFNFFNSALGTQIAQLPLPPRSSGLVFSFDKTLNVYAVSQESFGPVLTERAETIGRHKAYVAFTYQRFAFGEIDNNSLKNLSILFNFPNAVNPQVVTNSSTRVDATVNQYVALGTLGITDRIDVSVAVPFARVSMGVSSKGTEFSTTTNAMASFAEYLPGAAAGVGDVIVSGKYLAYKREKIAVAAGAELRFPSGDAINFLGSGAYGIEPYAVISRRGRVTPHLNVAYQWNSNSVLATNQSGHQDELPGYFGYTAGADVGLKKKVTVVVDLLGQLFFNAPQVSTPQVVMAKVAGVDQPFTTIVQENGSYDVNNLAVGFKADIWKNLLITANVTFKLNNGGLRATAVPLAGVSYSF